MEKLLISVIEDGREFGHAIRVSKKAHALLESVAKRSGRSKSYIASHMIEFAFDYIEYDDEDDEEE